MRVGLQTWGSEGDIRPMLALAAGLRARGHATTLVITGQPDADLVARASRHDVTIEVTEVPGLTDAARLDGLMASWAAQRNPLVQARSILCSVVDPAVPAMRAAAHRLCRDSDLVVAHFFVHPLIAAAQRREVPCAVVHLAHTGLPSRELAAPGFPPLGSIGNRVGWAVTRRAINGLFLGRINASRAAEGLPAIADVMRDGWTSSSLTLLAVSRWICRRPADWPSVQRVCGFLELPPEAGAPTVEPALEDFLAAGAPPVYFTFGSLLPRGAASARAVAAVWREAARRAGCRAIMQLPPSVQGEQDDGQAITVHRTPHALVFPRCAAIVHHGGAGTLHTAVAAGVPSVVVPHVADQFFWARELRRLRVAGPIVPRRRLAAGRLAQALTRTLADADASAAARILAQRLATERGVDVACSLLEEVHRA